MIRRLAEEDAEAFRILRLEALRLNPASFGSEFEVEEQFPLSRFAEMIASGAIYGFFRDSALAGVMALRFNTGRKRQHRCVLWGVYTRPEYRGQGISAQLLDFVLAEARSAGLDWIDLTVASANTSAKALYVSRGFATYGKEPAGLRVDGVDYDEDLMTLRLG